MPLAADAFQVFTAVVMLIIGFAGWLGQQVKNKQQGAKPRPAQPRREARVQDEIERFLQEVTGQKEQERARPRPEARSQPREQRSQPGRKPSTEQRSRERSAAATPETARLTDRDTSTQRPASTVRQPVRDSRAAADRSSSARRKPKVKAKVARSDASPSTSSSQRPRSTTPTVGRPLAGSSLRAETVIPAVSAGGSIDLAELRDPAALRKAIIYNEIFGRPKSLRRDES